MNVSEQGRERERERERGEKKREGEPVCSNFLIVHHIVHYLLYPAEVTEGALLRDLIFVFQNIDGQYIQFDSHQDAFRLTKKVHVLTTSMFMYSRLY